MKMKIWALLLAAALLLGCLAGCAKTDDDVRGDIKPNQTDASQNKPDDSKPQDSKPQDSKPEDSKPQGTDEQVSMGSSQGGKYENKFIGIGCQLDENWTFMTDEEIREQNNITSDILGEEYQQQLENATVIYDMMATHSNEMNTVNVNLEKLSGAANLLSEKSYVESSVEALKSALESAGMENVQIKAVEMEFAGGKHHGVQIEGEFSGIKCYEALACVKRGGYMACITACTWMENGTQAILDSFYAVK